MKSIKSIFWLFKTAFFQLFIYVCGRSLSAKLWTTINFEMNMNRQWTRERFKTISNILFWKPRSSSFFSSSKWARKCFNSSQRKQKKSAAQHFIQVKYTARIHYNHYSWAIHIIWFNNWFATNLTSAISHCYSFKFLAEFSTSNPISSVRFSIKVVIAAQLNEFQENSHSNCDH